MSLSKAITYNRHNWEDSSSPILCPSCLGENPNVRMIKERYDKNCKICTRPFTCFRWCPGMQMRFKRTEICQACARMKNVCQTCVLDLVYGLPTQVRDVAIMNANKSAARAAKNKTLIKLSRMAPYRSRICSFWLRGKCRRAEGCPYRHEKPHDPNEVLYSQNIRDRYYGNNDLIAEKMLHRVGLMPKLDVPLDKTISTLYVGNLSEQISEAELLNVFYPYGEIRSVTLVPRQSYAFVQYFKRSDAELAAERTFSKLSLKGRRLIIKWARTQQRPFPLNFNKNRRFAGEDLSFGNGEIYIMPPGLKLRDLPPSLIPTSVYKQIVQR
ncbi:pre-mRNA-splicing factor RBM22 [Drosophila mojavensis]|uniref:Uncharacterized protein n=1 Tax=Drosophila mojavensis TaxID=7230 RepID=B4L1I8_DROMO|nr:pre-mRNA-splicing factor RBM22 [Drosophila mojavensis]EDW07624.1 uncharacterized protein Dmoj_GI14756 [Drosophila mojavensis]